MKQLRRTASLATLLILCVFFITACAPKGSPSNEQTQEEILAVLNQQVAEWNRADIPAFMETYVKGDALRFSSGGNVRRGWQETFERYQKAYPSPEAMGHLTFVDFEVMPLSEEWAQVHGRYILKRSGDYSDATGLFTLLLQNTKDGWKILHDHTSAAE
jgi:ketosteroid isomerase-like protein